MPQTLSLNLVHVVFSTKGRAPLISEVNGPALHAYLAGTSRRLVGPADLGALMRYIDGQKAHHAKRSFEDEMRGFCEKYHVSLDERYAWD